MITTLTPQVLEGLEASFVEGRDILDGMRQRTPVQDPNDPGTYTVSFMLTVRRPMDLETAEIRRVTARMRLVGGADEEFEVFAVDGLADGEV